MRCPTGGWHVTGGARTRRVIQEQAQPERDPYKQDSRFPSGVTIGSPRHANLRGDGPATRSCSLRISRTTATGWWISRTLESAFIEASGDAGADAAAEV